MLRRALELGERGDRRAGLGGGRVVDLEQQGLVGLDDQWPVGHDASFLRPLTGRGGVELRVARATGTTPSAPGEERHTGRCTPRGPLSRTGYTPAPRTHACRADHTGLPRPSPSPSGRVGTGVVPRRVGRPTDPVPMRRSDGSADDSDAPRARTLLLRARPAWARHARVRARLRRTEARHPPRAEHTSARGVRKPSVRRVRVRPDVIGSRRVEQEPGDVGVTSTETRSSWSDRLSPRNWPLVWKLVAVGLVPALLALVLGVLRVADQAHTASQLDTANELLEVRTRVAAAADALRVERDKATVFIAERRLGDRGPLQDAVAQTDGALEQARAQARRRDGRPRPHQPHRAPGGRGRLRPAARAAQRRGWLGAGGLRTDHRALHRRHRPHGRARPRAAPAAGHPRGHRARGRADGRQRGVRSARPAAHRPRRRPAHGQGDHRRPGGRQRHGQRLHHRRTASTCSRWARPRRRSTSSPRPATRSATRSRPPS